MDEWMAVTVLPNIELETAIEGGMIALAPRDDARVSALCKGHPNLRSFMGKFTDAFGVKLRPALLIVRKDAPKSVISVEAIASFREAIAISVTAYNRAKEILYPRGHRITFSNAFWFYPWMPDKEYDDLIANTPAMLALHEVNKFKGQSTPEISPIKLMASDLDKTLLIVLCERWTRR